MSRFLGILLLLLFAGCASESGAPGSGITTPWEQKEILGHIRFLEESNGRKDCSLNVVNVENRGKELDGTVEFWTIESCGVKTVYKVRKAGMGSGNTRYSVSYPRPADLL